MSNIDTSTWKKFKASELFEIHPTAIYKLTNQELFQEMGSTPVLSNSSRDNGILGYCSLAPTEQGNIITFSDTTTGTDTIFYQNAPFIGYSHIQGMYPIDEYLKNNLDEKLAMFIISSLKCALGSDWSYSKKMTRKIVSDIEILLPAKEIDVPDWDYMQEYIEELEQEYIEELEQEYIEELEQYLIVSGLNDYNLTEEDRQILELSRGSA